MKTIQLTEDEIIEMAIALKRHLYTEENEEIPDPRAIATIKNLMEKLK